MRKEASAALRGSEMRKIEAKETCWISWLIAWVIAAALERLDRLDYEH